VAKRTKGKAGKKGAGAEWVVPAEKGSGVDAARRTPTSRLRTENTLLHAEVAELRGQIADLQAVRDRLVSVHLAAQQTVDTLRRTIRGLQHVIAAAGLYMSDALGQNGARD
jgi:hypothetical protein